MATTTLRTSPEVCGMGHSMKRKEDPRFIRGQGNYIDDIKLPGHALHGHRAQPLCARQDHEHQHRARRSQVPGVLAVITGETLKPVQPRTGCRP